MRLFGYGRSALGVSVAIAFLPGCGGGQLSMGDGVAQGATTAQARHGASWMKPASSSDELVYVSSPKTNDVYVYSYPGGSLVGTLTGFESPKGLCSDASGDVWITNTTAGKAGYLLEYAHAGTSPIATLEDNNGAPQGCTVDATTGNLAVSNIGDVLYDVAVYSDAQGSPTYYSTAGFCSHCNFITYDGSGNLYVAGYKQKTAWLPEGGATVMRLYITPKSRRGGLGWDGSYFTVQLGKTISRYNVSDGKTGKAVGTVQLTDTCCDSYYAIQDSGLIISQGNQDEVYFYSYPQGGYPMTTISGLDYPLGVAISVAASHSHKLSQ